MHKWYVVQVFSGHEKKVQRALREFIEDRGMSELIEEVLLPTENVSEVKGGERQITERRIWPGYLLIRMVLSDDSWRYVKETTGVIDFKGELSDQEVNDILSELQEKKERVTEKHTFDVGDKVKIVDGVFVNFVGAVTSIAPDKGRISVVVSIFGRDTQVDDLELWQIEELTDEE